MITMGLGVYRERIEKRRRQGNIADRRLAGMERLVAQRKDRRGRLLAVLCLAVAVAAFGGAVYTVAAPDSGAPDPDGPVGVADGVLPERASPFETSLPGIAKLDPALRKAVQRAARAMQDDDLRLHVTTGWRSRRYQQQLLDDAIDKYGSKEEAGKYVADPDKSQHVTGDAVDLGPADADDWLIREGYKYGLCQTLANEKWHFELATEPGTRCPPPAQDAASVP